MQQLNFSVNARSTLAQRSLNARSTLAIFCSLVVLFSNSGCKKKNNPIVATGLSISQTKTATMVLNRTLQLTPTFTPENVSNKTLTYTSSNDAIATVTDSGLITALALGNVTITATTTDGSNKTDTVNITVVVPDADISIKNFKLNDGTSDYILIPAGDNFTYPNAPRSLSLPATTLTATFDLGSSNATISPDPRTTPLSYANKTQFTVTSGDGTVTHTYYVNVGADAYDAINNPYGIYTPAHLSDVRNALDASYKLMNDIALPNITGYDTTADPAGMKIADYATAGWLPIGTDENTPFSGTLDGNGHIISNFSLNRTLKYNGFFGFISSSGEVKNLGVETSAEGITATSSNGYIGVLAGGNSSGNISNCYTAGVATGNGTTNAIFSGGLFGLNGGNINNCYTTCNTTSSGNAGSIGGLVGWLNGSISSSYSSNRLTNSGTGNAVGGITGFLTGNINNCYWDTTLYSGKGVGSGDATGTTGKTTTEMETQATVDLLNGSQTPKPWKLNSSGYPKLSWEQ